MRLQQLLSKNNLLYIHSVEYAPFSQELKIKFIKNPKSQKESLFLLLFREVKNFAETIDDLDFDLDCLDSILGVDEIHKISNVEYSITTEQRFIQFTTSQKLTLASSGQE